MSSSNKSLLWIGAILTGFLLLTLLPGREAQSSAQAGEGEPRGMFQLYEDNRKAGIPNYITEDFILLAQSLVINQAVTEIEAQVLRPDLQALVEGLISNIKAQTNGPDKIAQANLNFLSVVKALLNGRDQAPSAPDPGLVQEEIKKVLAAKGLAVSKIALQKIDYSQFRVRGKYTKSQDLGRYFRAVRYAGTVLFPVKESKATGINGQTADRLTLQALALSRLLIRDPGLSKVRLRLDRNLTLLFGPSEELGPRDYLQAAGEENRPAPARLRQTLLRISREQARQPGIISLVVDLNALEQGVTVRDVATGWRLLPGRFTPDSAAFQALVYGRVGQYQGQGRPFSRTVAEGKVVKGFPLALELMALLGSGPAGERLLAGDETSYQGYGEAATKAKACLAKGSGIPAQGLRIINYWLSRGQAAQKDDLRRLNTCLGFWTFQRYISLLYAKQSYTARAKSVSLSPDRDSAWLEPAPELYLYLQDQIVDLSEVLESKRLTRMALILGRLKDISQKELMVGALAKEEIDFLNQLDLTLLKLTGGKDLPIVVDVHTEPNSGLVLEQGLGHPGLVFRELDGKKARGGLFNYYEFKHPLADRLTDEKWRKMLGDKAALEKLELSPGSTAGLMKR